MPNSHYSGFVAEAFLNPIRSVLIVDDDYPTYDEVLEREMGKDATKKSWRSKPAEVQKVIKRFRSSALPLLVDIHDGANVEEGEEVRVASHLHQSDLLVLDYQLDAAKPGDGTRAINILRSLASNDHFNLVVVHTSEDLDIVFAEIRLGLLSPKLSSLDANDVSTVNGLIRPAEDEHENFVVKLERSVDLDQYLFFRADGTNVGEKVASGGEPFADFVAICPDSWSQEDRGLVLNHLFHKFEARQHAAMSSEDRGLTWSEGAVKWLRSDSVFVAFSAKGGADDLLVELQAALDDWSPQPSRLFLTKLRSVMDERGIVAQSQALGNSNALAFWYYRLLGSDKLEKRWLVAESVSRHSEQLLRAIEPDVEDFASRLVDAELENGDPAKTCAEHFKVDLTANNEKLAAFREHNAFVCSKAPQGWHLTTGHVFMMNSEYWVCVSPACDMVPSQLSEDRRETSGDRLPFFAVRLEQNLAEKIPKDVQTNRYVFLKFSDGVKTFCFNKAKAGSAPTWHAMYAEGAGLFEDGGFSFQVSRNELGTDRDLVAKQYSAEVVSQLRYEYALNLIQKFGVHVTRTGLDFVG